MAITPDHFINLKNGRFDSTSKEQLDGAFAALKQSGRDRLAVHVHGGLVKEAAGMADAERLFPFYQSANVYPFFFVWESGLLETLSHNLEEIAKEGIFKRLLLKVLKWAAGKLGSGVIESSGTRPSDEQIALELQKLAVGEIPFSGRDGLIPLQEFSFLPIEEVEFENELLADPILRREVDDIVAALMEEDEIRNNFETTGGAEVRASRVSLISPGLLREIRDAQRAFPGSEAFGIGAFVRIIKSAIVVVARVVKRFHDNRDHGVHATVVEELLREFYVANVGELIWRLMKQDTSDAFKPDPNQFGGRRFLDLLKTHVVAQPDLRVTLIAHSAGAEFICNFIAHADATLPETFTFDILWLAPASRIQVFADTIEKYGRRLRDFRMFTMSDPLERADRLVPVVYPHSLLYFISGVLEPASDEPIVGMQRYYVDRAPYNGFVAVRRVKTFFAAAQNRTIFSVAAAGAGLNSDAAKHTAFNDPATTGMLSVQHLLASGF